MPLKHTVQEVELKTGAKGLVIHIPDSTIVSYCIGFRAGYDYVSDPSIQQAAHIMEHMVCGPNAKYPTVKAFSGEFTRNGAYMNAFTGVVNLRYVADCAQFEWKRILQLQQIAITQPKFLPETLASEKGNVREELTRLLDNNSQIMWQNMHRGMGGHRLNNPEMIETIDAVSIDDIIEHHRRTHTHANMRFVIAGDFGGSADEVIQLLESWNLPKGERLPIQTIKYRAAKPVLVQQNDCSNGSFGIIFTLPRVLEQEEYFSGRALSRLLTETTHSRIFGTARTDGICYSMRSSMTACLEGSSSWQFSGSVRSDNADKLFGLIKDELSRIVQGDVAQADIEDVKRYLTGYYQMQWQTGEALIDWYAGDYFYNDTCKSTDDIQKYIDAITPESVIELAREFINEKAWTMGESGSAEKEDVSRHHGIMARLFA